MAVKRPVKTPASDYVEIRIPKLWSPGNQLSSLVLVPLLFVAFLLGGFTMWLWNKTQEETNTPATTAQAAFIKYANTIGLNKKDFQACLTSGKYTQQVQKDISAGTAANVTATPTFFINGHQIVGAQPYSVFKQAIDKELQKKGSTGFQLIPRVYAQEISQPLQAGDTTVTPTPDVIYSVDNGHLPLLGNKGAKVAVVEFSDFQCPFCERFFTDTYSQLKKDYVDTGKISFVYRQFPLTSIHPNAEIAAEAAECANEQGKFWNMHDKLFGNQTTWSALPQQTTQ